MVVETAAQSAPKATHFIGDYAVVGKRLGRGGMATVYRVDDGKGGYLAAKELLPELATRKDMLRRFEQEFEVTNSLIHPNIIRFHKLIDTDGSKAILMDLVDGHPLRTLLKRNGPLDVGLACRVCAQIADAIAHCHEAGVLHRDLKPDNILMDRSGTVFVTDFGIARLEGIRLTRTGTVLGSPAYMSTEQLAGKSARHLDERVDIYALGAMLYELIEGKDPFRLKRSMDLMEVLAFKRERRPRPLRKVDDSELDTLIRGCLDPDRDKRPSRMDKLSLALHALADRYGEDGSLLAGFVEHVEQSWAAQKSRRKREREQIAAASTMNVAPKQVPQGSLVWGLAALGFIGATLWGLWTLIGQGG